jgi:hypothetical protein
MLYQLSYAHHRQNHSMASAPAPLRSAPSAARACEHFRSQVEVKYLIQTFSRLHMEVALSKARDSVRRALPCLRFLGCSLTPGDPNTRSLVWRGIATDQQNEPSKLQGKLDDMVKKSFEKYPPKEK